MRIATFAVLLTILICLPSSIGQPKVDPRTGMIRVLYMGDALMEAGFVTPIIAQDPMIKLSPVPVEFVTGEYDSITQAARTLRVYFPRVESQVTEGYDVVIIADAREPFFPHKIQNWVRAGVLEYSLGFLMAGGPQSFGGYEPWGHPSWEGSPIDDILPVNCLRDWKHEDKVYRLVVPEEHEDHPLVRNIPWRYLPLFCRNRVQERQGSVVVGRSDNYPPNSPILVYSEMGEGMSEAFVFDWGGNGPKEFHRSEYAPIILSNMIYWIARVEIPEDMGMLLSLRTRLTKYFSMRRYVLSVIDFAEKFGANMNKANQALTESGEDRDAIIDLYVNGEYETSLSTLDAALEKLDEVTTLAMDAKDQALLWVYIIEWFTVTGTAMSTGVIVWTLMVKRAAYREVGVTRFDESR